MDQIISGRMKYAVLILGLIYGLTGCISSRYFSNKSIDVSNDPSWWGELAKGEVLRLNQDALLSNGWLNLGAWITTGPNGTGEKISVEQYKSDSIRYSHLSIHLLSKGTQMRCIRLERFFSLENSQYKLFAEIIDGECKGQLANILVTGNPNEKGTLRLNAEFLEPIK